MEINSKIVKGIYLYAPDVKFTEGDFVVEGDKMYICKENSMGKLPSENPDQFRPYLGGDTTEVISDGNTGLVSSYSLGKLLFGTCNLKGVLTNSIASDGSVFLRDFFGDDSGIELGDKYLDPLDNLMVSDINQIIVNVSKDTVKSILGSTMNNNPLLKQYTYETSSTLWSRVQELINVDTGDIYYRAASKMVPEGQNYESYSWSAPGEWKNVSVNSSFKTTISEIKANYNQKCHDLDIIKNQLIGSFRFKKVDFKRYEEIVNEKYKYSIPSSELGEIITITVRVGNEIHSITIDLVSEISNYIVSGQELSVVLSNNVYTFEGPRIVNFYRRVEFNEVTKNKQDYARYLTVNVVSNRNIIINSIFNVPLAERTNYIRVNIPEGSSIVFPITCSQATFTITSSLSSNITAGTIVVTRDITRNCFNLTSTGRVLFDKSVKASYVYVD